MFGPAPNIKTTGTGGLLVDMLSVELRGFLGVGVAYASSLILVLIVEVVVWGDGLYTRVY